MCVKILISMKFFPTYDYFAIIDGFLVKFQPISKWCIDKFAMFNLKILNYLCGNWRESDDSNSSQITALSTFSSNSCLNILN